MNAIEGLSVVNSSLVFVKRITCSYTKSCGQKRRSNSRDITVFTGVIEIRISQHDRTEPDWNYCLNWNIICRNCDGSRVLLRNCFWRKVPAEAENCHRPAIKRSARFLNLLHPTGWSTAPFRNSCAIFHDKWIVRRGIQA